MKLARVLPLIIVLIAPVGYTLGQRRNDDRAKSEAYERTLQEGLEAYARGQFEEAAIAFKRATDLVPGESEAFNSLGMALVRLNRFNEATAALRKAVQLNPQNPEARFNLARRYRVAGHLPEAVKELLAAVEVRPEYEEAWSDMGDALVEMSRKAISKLEREITIKPVVPMACFTLGYVAYRIGRLEQSAAHLREAIALNSRFAGARNLLGLVYFAQNKESEAMIELEGAVALDPAYETARYNLALLCIAYGRRDEALRHYQTLRSLDSQLSNTLLNLLSGNRVVNARDLLIKK